MTSLRRPELATLERMGLTVAQFTEYHYRVAGRLDLFPNDRGRPWRFHDLVTDRSGTLPSAEVQKFVPEFIKGNPKQNSQFVQIAEKGWWVCPMPGCAFRMRDEGSVEAARRIRQHAEEHQ